MAKKIYDNTKADYINLRFICNCGKTIETGLIPARIRYDNNKDINSFFSKKTVICPECNLQHTIHFFDDMFSASVEIPTLDKDDSIIYLHEIPLEYAVDYDNALLDYVTEIIKIKDFIGKAKELEVYDKSILYKMSFVYTIAILDAYLGNLFRYYIKKYDLFKENYLSFKSKNIKLSNAKSLLNRLNTQSFQNLDMVAIPYYEKTFGISIPHNETIQNAVEVRNKIIHHSGREKDGYEYPITESHVQNLIGEVVSLVKFVNQRMNDVVFEKIVWPNIEKQRKY